MDGRRFEELLRTQRNFITRSQALECGITAGQIRTKLVRGDWREVGQGYYWVASTSVPHEDLIYAAIEAGAGAGVASHRSAGRVHEIWGMARSNVLEVTVSNRAYHPIQLTHPVSGVVKKIHVHSARDLPESDVTEIRGVPCTTRYRTLINAAELYEAGEITRPRLVSAYEYCVRMGDRLEFWERLDELKEGRRGMDVLADLVSRHTLIEPHVQSPGEGIAEDILWSLDLRPERQYPVVVDGHEFFIDLAFPELLLAIEIDSFLHHNDWDARQLDMWRDGLLGQAGWLVHRTTWRRLMRPVGFAITIAKLLKARATQLGKKTPSLKPIQQSLFE